MPDYLFATAAVIFAFSLVIDYRKDKTVNLTTLGLLAATLGLLFGIY